MVDPRPAPDPRLVLPAPPEALAREAWILDPPDDGERDDVLRPEAAATVDGLLARVARGHAALDVAIGEILDSLGAGRRLMRLGYSGLGDYARERLGIEATTSRLLAKLARELRTRPLLREAVRSGEVSARKAQTVLPVARGEEEASWVERARRDTVRALQAAVREARCGVLAPPSRKRRDGNADIAAAPGICAALAAARAAADAMVDAARESAAAPERDVEEPWERVRLELSQEDRATLERAMAVAGRTLKPGAPRWERLEAVCQEYLGAHPVEPDEDEESSVRHAPVVRWLAAAKEALEEEMGRWDFLEPVPTVAAPVAVPGGDADGALDAGRGDDDPLALDARLRELSAMRDRWDVLLGHLAMLMKMVGLWRDAGFASFEHYCDERLGMAARTVEQRARLAVRSYELPGLREAMAEGRLGYEKARLVARAADEDTVGAWIERARTTPAIDLRREIEAAEDAQMCARGELVMVVPRGVRVLVDAVVRAAREAEKRPLTPGECLGIAAAHFLATWEPLTRRRRTRQQRVLERDRGRCLVPGCSRPADHAHHVRFRSAGGGDEDENLGSLCAPHHLVGVHEGWIRISGEAPDRLTFWMAAPPVPAT